MSDKVYAFDFYLLRRPLLSLDKAFAFADIPTLELFLRETFQEPLLQEAIYLASPTFFERFRCWIAGNDISEKDKLLSTLLKYFLRMSTRSTPYGLFAGCSIGKIGASTNLQFNGLHKYARLDMNYITELANYVSRQEKIKNQLLFYSNNTLYAVGKQLRYLFYSVEDKKRHYSVCSIDNSAYVELILKKAESGAYLAELAEELIRVNIDREEAKSFIQQLVDEQILFSEIEPTITGEDFFKSLTQKLSYLSAADAVSQSFKKIQQLLENQTTDFQKYYQIKEQVNAFVETAQNDLIQTDLLFESTKNTIDKAIITALTDQLQQLLVLNQGYASEDLEHFKKRFYERYDEQEIPLAIALDSEIGIGYGNNVNNEVGETPLIDDILLPAVSTDASVKWSFWKKFSLKKYTEALLSGQMEVVLTANDLKEIKENIPQNATKLPSTAFVLGSFMANSEKNLDKDNFVFHLKNFVGTSAISLMGRFGHISEELTQQMVTCGAYEQSQHPEVIFAEIVHLPEARTGNILARPILRPYEIPYLTYSNLPADNQFPVQDLMVSVSNGEVILRSKKLNKRVIPRMANAHNFENGLSIYKFLCELPYDYQFMNVAWPWQVLDQQTFLPRVRYENIILQPATWNFVAGDYPELSKKGVDIGSFFKELQRTNRLPQYVNVVDDDNELWIDFDNIHCLALLKEWFLKHKKIRLSENLLTPDKCLLTTPTGNFASEIIIPCQLETVRAPPRKNRPSLPVLPQSFMVGSEWLYFKIYAGEKTLDEILINEIYPLVQQFIKKKVFDRFFFVRYYDPEPHLRIRFHGNPATQFYAKIIKQIHQRLLPYEQQKRIHQLQMDTYKREIERYGEQTMELSEELFFQDSLTTLAFLATSPDETQRWVFGLKKMDNLLQLFGYNLEEKMLFVTHNRDAFLREFGGDKLLRRQLNDNFRKHETVINEAFSTENLLTSLEDTVKKINWVVSEKMEKDGLIGSYLHMLVNRLFYSNQRLHELVLYHYLFKHYRSTAGILKKYT